MLDTMTRYLEMFRPTTQAYNLRRLFLPSIDRLSTQALTSAGLVIHGAASALVKTGAADFYASVQGSLVKIAASTDLPALTGFNVSANDFNVACFYVDGSGTVTMLAGTQGATLGKVTFPIPPQSKALVGFIIVTSTGTFTGGTTNLDAAGVTVVYVNPLGGFDPSALIG